MNRYAVGHMDFFNNDLKIVIIEAGDEVQALIKGVGDDCNDEDIDRWLSQFNGKTLEEIKTAFFDADRLVAVKLIK